MEKETLNEVYTFIYLDVIHYNVREEGGYISKAFYCWVLSMVVWVYVDLQLEHDILYEVMQKNSKAF